MPSKADRSIHFLPPKNANSLNFGFNFSESFGCLSVRAFRSCLRDPAFFAYGLIITHLPILVNTPFKKKFSVKAQKKVRQNAGPEKNFQIFKKPRQRQGRPGRPLFDLRRGRKGLATPPTVPTRAGRVRTPGPTFRRACRGAWPEFCSPGGRPAPARPQVPWRSRSGSCPGSSAAG